MLEGRPVGIDRSMLCCQSMPLQVYRCCDKLFANRMEQIAYVAKYDWSLSDSYQLYIRKQGLIRSQAQEASHQIYNEQSRIADQAALHTAETLLLFDFTAIIHSGHYQARGGVMLVHVTGFCGTRCDSIMLLYLALSCLSVACAQTWAESFALYPDLTQAANLLDNAGEDIPVLTGRTLFAPDNNAVQGFLLTSSVGTSVAESQGATNAVIVSLQTLQRLTLISVLTNVSK